MFTRPGAATNGALAAAMPSLCQCQGQSDGVGVRRGGATTHVKCDRQERRTFYCWPSLSYHCPIPTPLGRGGGRTDVVGAGLGEGGLDWAGLG